MKAYRRADGEVQIFRPEQNAMRMQMGAERLLMVAPSVEQYVDEKKLAVNFAKAEERKFSVDEFLEADEVFCTGTAVGISAVGSATYKNTRYNRIQNLDSIINFRSFVVCNINLYFITINNKLLLLIV